MPGTRSVRAAGRGRRKREKTSRTMRASSRKRRPRKPTTGVKRGARKPTTGFRGAADPGTRSVRPDDERRRPGPRAREAAMGMGLAFKFALMTSCMVAFIMGIYGVGTAVSTWKDLENRIMLRGASQVQTLALLGRVLIAQAELEDTIDKKIRDSGEGGPQKFADVLGEDLMKKLQALRLPLGFLRPLLFGSGTEATDEELVDAVIGKGSGGDLELLVSIHGENVHSPTGTRVPLELRTGWGAITVDVMVKRGPLSIAGREIGAIEFSKSIVDESNVRIGEAMLILSEQRVIDAKNRLIQRVAVFSIVAVLAAIAISLMMASRVTRPIRQLVHDMMVVSEGNLEHRSLLRSRDEIGLLSRSFNEMTKSLAVAQVAALEKERLSRDLDIAQQIQNKLLPDRKPKIPGYDISAFYKAARDVGGDYYDFIPIDRQHIGMMVADVSGKGIQGSLVMTMTRTIVRFEAQHNPSPADTLKKVNRILAREIRKGMFVTAFYVILDVVTHTITYSSAGHNPMVFVRNSTGKQWILNPGGIALGFDGGAIFDNTVKEEKLSLAKGDRIVLYTDGVVEAMNAQKQQFGEKRFYELARRLAPQNSDTFVNLLVQELERHRGNAEQHDDITISTFMLS